MVCKQCNAEIETNQKFCHQCGCLQEKSISDQSVVLYRKSFGGKVSKNAQKEFSEIFESGFDDEPRTKISELLDIIEQSGGVFPDCHALVSGIYLEAFSDIPHSQKHVKIALEQEPTNALAIFQDIVLKYNSISQTASTAKKVIDKTSWMPYLGTVCVLSAAATAKINEANIISSIINEVRFLSTSALPTYFNYQDGFYWLAFVAEMMLGCQEMIRNDKRLYSALKNTLPVALMNLTWDKVILEPGDEARNGYIKLLKKIKGETRI